MACHHHETDVRRRERTLKQRDAFSTRKSHASLVGRLADRTDSNTLVVEDNADLVGDGKGHQSLGAQNIDAMYDSLLKNSMLLT